MASCIVVLLGCAKDAPHSNPLDPASPKYDASGVVLGRCTRVYDATAAVTGVTVVLQPAGTSGMSQGRVTWTDEQGRFRFLQVAPDSYYVVLQKSGYVTDTLSFRLGIRDSALLNIGLDAEPRLEAVQLTTGHTITSDSSQQHYWLEIKVQVEDPDRNLDIETVTCRIDTLGVTIALLPDADRRRWETSVRIDTLAGNQPDDYIGVPLAFVVRTNTNFRIHHFRFEPFYLIRFIHAIPVLVYPRNNQVTDRQPTFRWRRPNVGFAPVYDFEISRIVGPGEFETTRVINLQADSTYTHGSRLVIGSYFWRLFLKDSFGNWARSKPETFEVR